MKAHWVQELRELGQVNQQKFLGSDSEARFERLERL